MEQSRIIIAIALSIIVFITWDYFFSGKKDIKKQDTIIDSAIAIIILLCSIFFSYYFNANESI